MSNSWADHDLQPALKAAGIYDPEPSCCGGCRPAGPADLPELPVDEIIKLTGDAARGKNTATRCVMCHSIDGSRRRIRARRSTAGGAASRPRSSPPPSSVPTPRSRTGYDGTELATKDGLTIQGVLIKEGDPLMMRSMGGLTQIIPADRVGTRRRMRQSLMMSAAQLGLTAQDVADLVAFLRSN